MALQNVLAPVLPCTQHAWPPDLRQACLQVRWFDFVPSLQQQMQEADLIISHAGSGSLFEALHLRKVGASLDALGRAKERQQTVPDLLLPCAVPSVSSKSAQAG